MEAAPARAVHVAGAHPAGVRAHPSQCTGACCTPRVNACCKGRRGRLFARKLLPMFRLATGVQN